MRGQRRQKKRSFARIPAALAAALLAWFPFAAAGQAPPVPPVPGGVQEAPPPPPPAGGNAPPPIANDPSEELMDHRPKAPIKVILPPPPSGPWLEASGDCRALLKRGQPSLALACASPKELAVSATALEQLGLFSISGITWRRMQTSDARGQLSLEVMRRGNAMAELEDGITALSGGMARAAVKRFDSALQTLRRQAGQPSLAMPLPGAAVLQRALGWRARRKHRAATSALQEAQKDGLQWVSRRARLHLARLSNRRQRKGPWPLVERTYGDRGDDGANAVDTLPDGDLVIAGFVSERGPEGAQLAVWRTDPAGQPRWLQTFGGKGHDEAHAVLALDDGGVLAIGETADGEGNSDILVVRMATDRSILWHHSLGGPGSDRAVAVTKRPGGGFWAATTTQAGTVDADMRLLKLSADGSERQLVRLRGAGEDKSTAIAQRGKGALVAGSGRGKESGPWEGRLVALGPRAEVLWKQPVRYADGCTIEAIAIARRGGIMAAGRAWVAGSSPRLFLSHVAQGGRVKWTVADRRLADVDVAGLVLTGRSHVAILARGRYGAGEQRVWLLGYRGKRARWLAPIAPGVRHLGGLTTVGRYGLAIVGHVDDVGRGHRDGWLMRTGR